MRGAERDFRTTRELVRPTGEPDFSGSDFALASERDGKGRPRRNLREESGKALAEDKGLGTT